MSDTNDGLATAMLANGGMNNWMNNPLTRHE